MLGENCKICGSSSLTVFKHTAICNECGILLYYPYPPDDCLLLNNGEGKPWPKERVISWYSESSFYNHTNFTRTLRFAMDESYKGRKLDILDYGGGGGQFALICKSHFPESNVYITDICDDALLEEWKSLNIQIPFKDFDNDNNMFDVIFLNDVFEHVSDPYLLINQLGRKLKPGGKCFIDTPKQFWIYPVAKFISKPLYEKILRGTVSTFHLQIWSKNSFELVVNNNNLKIEKYKEISEYTMPPDFYLKNMRIKNPILKLIGRIFYHNAKWLAKNKIICVLSKKGS